MENKKYKRDCKKHTLYTLHSDEDNVYREMKNVEYNTDIKIWLNKKYGDDLKEIINNRFTK